MSPRRPFTPPNQNPPMPPLIPLQRPHLIPLQPPQLIPLQRPLIPLQPSKLSQNYTQLTSSSGLQPGNLTYQAQQHPQYMYQSPPMICHPSNFSLFNAQPSPPLHPPLPPTPHPSTLIPPPPLFSPPPFLHPPLPFAPHPSTLIPPPPLFSLPPPPPLPPTPHPSTLIPHPPLFSPPPTPPLPDSPPPPLPPLPPPEFTSLPRTHMLPMPIGSKSKTVENPWGQIGGSRMNRRIQNRLRRPTSFICKMKFRNVLPDLTAQPKFLPLRRDPDRYTRYNPEVEKSLWKPELYPEPDLGIPLDLLDLSVYNPPKGERLPIDPEDEELLRDDDDPVTETPSQQTGLRRKSRPDDQSISWLLKTPHRSSVNKKTAKKPLAKRKEKEMPQRLGRRRTLVKTKDRRDRIKEIEASFEACKSLPTHATNANLHPVEVIPLLPDFDRLNDQYVVASFGSDPTGDSEAYKNLSQSVRHACESKAVMKRCTVQEPDSNNTDKFLAYLAPSPDEMSTSKAEEQDISYSLVREYNYNVQFDDPEDPKSFLVSFDDSKARYLPLPTKLKLRKKKLSKKIPTKAVVRRRSAAEETAVQEEV